ncbi:MAG: succinylglutamate desuccinylase/aspartoacylase family protein [Legionellales bacterium]|nr:succinylglutamate desuccinylase/aspartoacylase family protein [Legionellales bacterium]
MKNKALQICNETIHPGETLSLALPLPELFSCAPLYMPIKIAHGTQAGPILMITAAIHGNELNGTEIINRLLNLKVIKQLRGTLIAVPIVNVYGFINRSRLLPGGINLDHCFPGSKNGTHASRVAHLFYKEIFAKAQYCIDLQTGFINYSNLPQIYYHFGDRESQKLAESFNAPVISHLADEPGSLHHMARQDHVPFIVYEAGEAMRFDEHAIRTGVSGILNILKFLDMLPHKNIKDKKIIPSFVAEKNIWVRASTSGLSQTTFKLGQSVKKGKLLATIQDPFGASEKVNIYNPEDAIIVGKNNLPLVHEGEALFQLAVFSRMQQAETHFEDWQEQREKLTSHSQES